MRKRRFLPALMALLMLATAVPTFIACSDDDDDNNSPQPESPKPQYDDLDIFQRAICNIDSAGQLVRYQFGEALYDAEP